MRLASRAAMVTGAGRGIGRGIALRLAAEGAHVLVADLDAATGTETARAIEAQGGKARFVAADVARPEASRAAVAETLEAFGRLDVLVNNAGVIRARPLLDLAEDDWDRTFAVNARGLFFCLQAAARAMVRAGGGCIINVASIAGRWGRPLLADYAASKAAVISVTQSAALALAPHRVRVNAVCPGVVDTAMWAQIDQEWGQAVGAKPGEVLAGRVAGIPLGRIETPEDVAGLVAFLASDDAAYITGQAINVCGGLHLG
jgi:meso-butanediol dehydrogenase / (S,S)-butanediol dehydrogenase / diacetyl reductase